MTKIKSILAITVSLLILIIILQNTQAVEARLLFMKATMPHTLLLLVTLLIGFVIGIVTASHFSGKPAKSLKNNQKT